MEKYTPKRGDKVVLLANVFVGMSSGDNPIYLKEGTEGIVNRSFDNETTSVSFIGIREYRVLTDALKVIEKAESNNVQNSFGKLTYGAMQIANSLGSKERPTFHITQEYGTTELCVTADDISMRKSTGRPGVDIFDFAKRQLSCQDTRSWISKLTPNKWERFKNGKLAVEVPMEDLVEWLTACEDHQLTWLSGDKPTRWLQAYTIAILNSTSTRYFSCPESNSKIGWQDGNPNYVTEAVTFSEFKHLP